MIKLYINFTPAYKYEVAQKINFTENWRIF